ncbi:MAG: asparaginase domain-containing protein [Lachnospiraceae bacterium]
MKVGVVFTGGTIGSEVNQSGYIAAKSQTSYFLLEQYHKMCENNNKEKTQFIIRKPYTILSENITYKELELLIACVKELLNEEDVEGIIVTHGTDTLQYSAALLGHVFSMIKVPVILVSSNYVLNDERANGMINFYYGMEFIKGKYGNGVFVSYCNKNDVPRIHFGTRLNMPVFYSDDVNSIENEEYGHFESCEIKEKSVFVKTMNEAILETGMAASNPLFENPLMHEISLKDCGDTILQIHPYVGIKYPEISVNTKVIIHGSFHSGTVAITEELREFAGKAKSMGIPFYLIGLSSKVTHYETVQFYKENGIIPLYDTAFISQYCKAWLIISNKLPLKEKMEFPGVWEQV